MRILQIQHWKPKFEFNTSDFFAARGDEVDDLLLFAGEPEPDPILYDAVIVYGGYMSAYDDEGNPWIPVEMRYLERCLKAETPILGICLGSQLLARVLGARVYKSPKPEFGFKRIVLSDEGRVDPAMKGLAANGAGGFLAIEWHADAWDLPAGAMRLASDSAWENQAFRYGPNIVATQFHLEFTQPHMAWAIAKSGGEMPADAAGEEPAAFAAPSPRYAEIQGNMETLLSGFLGCYEARPKEWIVSRTLSV